MVLVEVSRKSFLGSIVPVIVNAILNEHQIIVDIVAFVSRGDFPRSRLGEKQRGKILAGWVTRKMRTIAQFSIRDTDAGDMAAPHVQGGGSGGDGAPAEARLSMSSATNNRYSSIPGTSSLRNVEPAPQILEQEELDQQLNELAALPARASVPPVAEGVSEMDGGGQRYSHQSYGTQPAVQPGVAYGGGQYGVPPPDVRQTPTAGRTADFNPLPPVDVGVAKSSSTRQPVGLGLGTTGASAPGHASIVRDREAGGGSSGGSASHSRSGSGSGPIRLPGVDGRESLSEEDWTAEAIMHMNLAGDFSGGGLSGMDLPRGPQGNPGRRG